MLPEPMLAKKMITVPTGPQWLMEPKYDGWRALAGTIGGVRIETRTGNPIIQVPYLEQAITRSVSPDTILDGEIVDLRSGGPQWNRTETILSTTNGGYQHQPSVSDPPLTYVVFDVLKIAGEDLRHRPLLERKQRLTALLDGASESTGGIMMLSPVFPPSDDGLEDLLAEGYEGVVVKDVNSIYVCGGRRHGWFKIKPNAEIEAVCTGAYPAEPGSKYAPLVDDEPQPWAAGGLCFRVEHPDGRSYEGRAAGMDDQLRRELHENPDQFKGRVVELVHWGIQDTGALRHPNFKRFRSPAEKPGARKTAPRSGSRRSRRPAPPQTPRPAGQSVGATRRMRSYHAMGDEKLLRCIKSLRERSGEAYDRCISAGSGDPAKDLSVAEGIARERHLL